MKRNPTLGERHLSFWQARLDDFDQYYVYVIRGGKKAPVKIGKAKNPIQRLKTLQTGNAATLRLLLVVPGGEELEKVLHRRFAEYRLRGNGEWFYGPGVAEIIAFVTELAVEMVQAHVDGALDPPSLAGFPGWTEEERTELGQRPEPTIPMTLPSPPQPLPTLAEQELSFVPTLSQRIRRTALVAPPRSNRGPMTQ